MSLVNTRYVILKGMHILYVVSQHKLCYTKRDAHTLSLFNTRYVILKGMHILYVISQHKIYYTKMDAYTLCR